MNAIILPEWSSRRRKVPYDLDIFLFFFYCRSSFQFIRRLLSMKLRLLVSGFSVWFNSEYFSRSFLHTNYSYSLHKLRQTRLIVLRIKRDRKIRKSIQHSISFGQLNAAARWKHEEVDSSGEAHNGIPTAHRVDRHRTCMRGASTSSERHCGTAVHFLSLNGGKRITRNKEKRETYRPFGKYRYNCAAEVPSRKL